eukprot:m.50746 g.50746  ORF g.50746 m.50746 type:complete len:78 (+) comp11182_c0_seq1:13-246(+)
MHPSCTTAQKVNRTIPPISEKGQATGTNDGSCICAQRDFALLLQRCRQKHEVATTHATYHKYIQHRELGSKSSSIDT